MAACQSLLVRHTTAMPPFNHSIDTNNRSKPIDRVEIWVRKCRQTAMSRPVLLRELVLKYVQDITRKEGRETHYLIQMCSRHHVFE